MAKSKQSKKKDKRSKKAKAPKLPKSLRKGLPKPVAEVLAAGLGVLDRTQATGTDEFERLVARGRTVEQRGHDAVRGAADRVAGVVDDTVGVARARRDAASGAVQARIEAAVEAAVGALGLPTGGELDALRAEVARLETRVGAPEAGQAFRLAPHADGWALEREGASRAVSVHPTKKAGLVAARAHAKRYAPSTLTILLADGSVADTVAYDG